MRNDTGHTTEQTELIDAYRKATAEQAYYQGFVTARAVERASAAARLWDGGAGMSLAELAEVLELGSKSRAQQLVEKGRAVLADPAGEMVKGSRRADYW